MANVRVLVRVRPLSQKEKIDNESVIVKVDHENNTLAVKNTRVPENADYDSREKVRVFAFEECFDWDTPQEKIFNTIGAQVINSAFTGYNSCVLAYGQSGTGKTFSMMGNQECPGLTPRICHAVFPRLAETSSSHEHPIRITVSTLQKWRNNFITMVPPEFIAISHFSFLEIHNERVRDLLRNRSSAHLKVREHPQKGTYVEGLSEVFVSDEGSLIGLLNEGNSRRCTAQLGEHSRSSRSHAVFTLSLTRRQVTSKAHLVDLAGSERAASGGSRKQKEEGANINKSLVTLGNVISALAEKSRNSKRRYHVYIPYRDSVLTWLLRDSLGGNANTFMIATVSPANGSYSETVNTLRYAQRAKHIINKPKMNASNDDTNQTIQELKAEVAKLRATLAKMQMNGVAQHKHILTPCAADRDGMNAKRWVARYHRHISSLQHPCPQSYSTTLQFFMGQSSSTVGEAVAAPPPSLPTEEAIEVKEVPCALLPVMLLDHMSPADLRLSSSCDLMYRSPSRKISRSQHRDYSSQDSIPADSGLSPENSLASSSSSLESNRSLDSRKGNLIGASNNYKNKPVVRSGIPVRVRSSSSPDLTAIKPKKRTKQDIVADVTKRLYPIKKIRERALAAAASAANTEDGETCSRAANRLRELSQRLLDAHRRAKGKVEVETQTEKEQNTKEAAVETDNRLPAAVLASDFLLPVCLLRHPCGSPDLVTAVQPDLLNQCRSCEKLSDECFSDDSLDNCLHKSVDTDSLDDMLDNSPKQSKKIMYKSELGSQGGWEVKLEVCSEDGVVKVVHSSDDSRPVSSDDNNSCPSPLSSEGGSLGSDSSSGDDILYFMQGPQTEGIVKETPSSRYERSLYTILESSEHSDQSDGNAATPTAFSFEARNSPKLSSSPHRDQNKNFTIEILNNNGAGNFATSPTCSITFSDANCNHVRAQTPPAKEILFEGELKIRPKFAFGNILPTQSKPTVCYPNDSARLISNSFYPEFTKGLENFMCKNSPTFTSPQNFVTETTYANNTSITSPHSSYSSQDESFQVKYRSPSPAAENNIDRIHPDAPRGPSEIRSAEDIADTKVHSDKFHTNQYLNEEEIYEIKKIQDARDLSADSLKSNGNMARLPVQEMRERDEFKASSRPEEKPAVTVPWADPNQRKFLNISVTTPARGPCIVRRDASFNSEDSITFVFVGPNQKHSPPILMELIHRSSKGLRRSLSLDSATRALGRISKRNNTKSDANRSCSTDDLAPEETRSFLEPMKTKEGPNHNFKRLRREALTPSDSEVRSTDDDFDDSPPPEFPKSTGYDENQCWAEMKGIILGQQVRRPSNSPSPPPLPPRRRNSGKKAVSWSDISGCGLISSPSTHSLPSPVNNSPKPIIKKTTLPTVPQSRSPSPGFRDRIRLELHNRPLRERSVSIPGASRFSPCWGEDSSPSPERHQQRRDAFSRSPPRCSSPRCRSVGDMTQVGVEQEPIRQFLAQATDLLHSLSDLSRQIEQKMPPPTPPPVRFAQEDHPPLRSSGPAPCYHCSSYEQPAPVPRFSWYEPSPLERQLEASCARLEASLRNPPRWQELCEDEEPARPARRQRARWQQPHPLPPLPHQQQRPQVSPRAYMRYLLGVRKRIIQSARQEEQRKPDGDFL